MEEKSNNFDNLAPFFTLFMAVATFWLAIETYGLKMADLGPNVSLSDVKIQLIDDTGTPRKERSWREGELMEKGAVTANWSSAILVLKFLNTGKISGYVRLLNFEDISNKLSISSSTPDFESYKKLMEGAFIVPAENETGWLYSVDVLKEITCNELGIDLTFKLDLLDLNLKSIKKLEVPVHCQSLNKQAVCFPKI